jgi:hypothetical protein
MAKNKAPKTKAGTDPIARLADALAGSEAGEPAALGAALGLSEGFEAALARARELTRTPDPRQVINLPLPFQLAFVRLAERAGDDEQLTDLLSMGSERELKKEARRAIHALRSRGHQVDIPEERGGSVLERKLEEQLEELPCHLSPVSGQGNRMVLMARYTRGGVAVHQAELHDQDGLTQFAGGTLGRSRYRKLLGDLQTQGEGELLTIGYDEARWLVAKAAERTRQAGKSLPEGYLDSSGELGEVKDTAASPDPRGLLPPAELPDPAGLAAQAGELFEHPTFADWLPEADVLKLIEEKIKAVETSQVTINDEQRVDGVQKALDAGVAALVEGDRRARLQARLLEQAAYLKRVGQTEPAHRAAAAAYQLDQAELDPLQVPFLVRMLRRVMKSPEDIVAGFAPLAGAPAGGENEPPPEPTTPGGLILAP